MKLQSTLDPHSMNHVQVLTLWSQADDAGPASITIKTNLATDAFPPASTTSSHTVRQQCHRLISSACLSSQILAHQTTPQALRTSPTETLLPSMKMMPHRPPIRTTTFLANLNATSKALLRWILYCSVLSLVSALRKRGQQYVSDLYMLSPPTLMLARRNGQSCSRCIRPLKSCMKI